MTFVLTTLLATMQRIAGELAFFRYQELFVTWDVLARFGNGAIQFDDSAGFSAALRNQWAPQLHLTNIFHTDRYRSDLAGPFDQNPAEIPDFLLARLATGGLGVVRAIRRAVKKTYPPTAACLNRVDAPHIRLIVLSVWVICSMHRDGGRIVVDANGHRSVQTHFQPG
ncbi:hypothetical protein D3C85_1318600 [compost metagenome]